MQKGTVVAVLSISRYRHWEAMKKTKSEGNWDVSIAILLPTAKNKMASSSSSISKSWLDQTGNSLFNAADGSVGIFATLQADSSRCG